LLQRTFFEKLKLQTGFRYDYRTLASEAVGYIDSATYRAALDKSFGSFSGSIGATWQLSEELLFRANVASAYRAPNLAELTSNGPHETRYEMGENSLVSEKSYEADLGMHYHAENLTIDLACFYNRVNDFIYIAPTGTMSSEGLPIYQYMQNDSRLYGGEAGVHIHPKTIEWLHLEGTFSTVTGVQDNGNYLPFIPASKVNLEARAEKEKLLFLSEVFVSIRSGTAFSQDNIAPDETATSGYTLFDLTFGGNLKVQKQMVSIVLSANNLFDTKYIDHLSTLKEVGMYNPGRNIAFMLRVPFGK
jgi:iron complex outermembrane receptor protein